MANRLYKELTSQMGIELNYFHFVYGNIKPDVHPGTIDWPHFSQNSLDDLLDYCESITITPMSLKDFSIALGVVSHFLCDYSCLYHTGPYIRHKDIIKHALYEHFLELHFIKKCIMRDIIVTEQPFCEEIGDMLTKRLALYNDEQQSIDNDINYAVNTSSCVLKRLIELSNIQNRQMSELEIAYDF